MRFVVSQFPSHWIGVWSQVFCLHLRSLSRSPSRCLTHRFPTGIILVRPAWPCVCVSRQEIPRHHTDASVTAHYRVRTSKPEYTLLRVQPTPSRTWKKGSSRLTLPIYILRASTAAGSSSPPPSPISSSPSAVLMASAGAEDSSCTVSLSAVTACALQRQDDKQHGTPHAALERERSCKTSLRQARTARRKEEIRWGRQRTAVFSSSISFRRAWSARSSCDDQLPFLSYASILFGEPCGRRSSLSGVIPSSRFLLHGLAAGLHLHRERPVSTCPRAARQAAAASTCRCQCLVSRHHALLCFSTSRPLRYILVRLHTSRGGSLPR